MSREEKSALAEFCALVRTNFGQRVRAVTLFGSRARGESHEDSDVDVLVVVDYLSSAEARELCRSAGDILTRYDVLVSPLALPTTRYQELRARERLIIREIDRDGVPL